MEGSQWAIEIISFVVQFRS